MHQSPGEIKRREVELDSQVSPGETKRREVELDSQVSPGEIKRREVELNAHSKLDNPLLQLFLNSCFSDIDCVTLQLLKQQIMKYTSSFTQWLTVSWVLLFTSFPCPLFAPSLISLMVSVDVKPHVYVPCAGHSTATGGKEKYRPAYLEHFEKKEQEEKARMSNKAQPMVANPAQQQQQAPQPQQQPPPKQVTPPHHFQRSFIDGDFEFVSALNHFLRRQC